MLSILSVFFGIAVATTGPVNPVLTIDTWVPQVHDRLIVDTKENVGYLVHEDGHYVAFDVLTGQRRTVYYLGRTYNAATPTHRWTVKSTDIKGDHITFGPTGLFMRLYDEDEESTPYGIHGHAYYQEMMDSNNHFRSMGCVIVSEDMLKVINKTYEINGGTLDVVTIYGVELPKTTAQAMDASWLGY